MTKSEDKTSVHEYFFETYKFMGSGMGPVPVGSGSGPMGMTVSPPGHGSKSHLLTSPAGQDCKKVIDGGRQIADVYWAMKDGSGAMEIVRFVRETCEYILRNYNEQSKQS